MRIIDAIVYIGAWAFAVVITAAPIALMTVALAKRISAYMKSDYERLGKEDEI